MAYTWPTSISPDAATNEALGAAKQSLGGLMDYQPQYPTNYTGQLQGPAQQQTAAFVANPEYQRIGGLMGGDYDRLEAALRQPAQNAYAQTVRNMDARFGGSGLYGSTIQSQGLAQAGRDVLLPGLSQATAQRYGLQMQDMQRLGEQEQNAYKAGLLNAERQQGYNQQALNTGTANEQAQRDFSNRLAQQNFQYDLDREAFNRGLMQTQFENALGMATGTLPGYNANLAARTQQNLANQNYNLGQQQLEQQNLAGWLGAGGTLLGAALGSDGFWGLF